MRGYQNITNTSTGVPAVTSNWLPVDNNIIDFQLGLHTVLTTGAVTYTIQGTLDDVQDPNVVPVAFSLPISAFQSSTITNIGTLTMPVKAIRITQTGAGTTVTRALQQGII